MAKLQSFSDFSTLRNTKTQIKLQEEIDAKRNSAADAFKSMLSDFDVTSIKDLTEDQRIEFFTKLKGTGVNESVSLIEEGTRGQVGKIDKKGNIESVYIHYDSYPENILPLLRKGYKGGKNIDTILKGGASSGLESSPSDMNFYKDGTRNTKGSISNVSKYLKDVANDGGAEFAYLWDEANKEWLMADIYGKGYDEVYPAFEALLVMEAISVQYKRDAKKVHTVYKNIFGKKLTDFGAMDKVGMLGCIKYLFEEAMTDANFHREVVISKNIKGRIGPFELKAPGLGNHFLKIGATTTKRILDKYYSDLANASGWSGIGIVEGTALYLESIREEAMGQALLNAFNMFESKNNDNVGDLLTEKDDAGTHLDNLADLVGNAKSFMEVGKELKAGKYKYDFSTNMMPMYMIQADGFKFAILNKKYVDGGDREVGDIAIGLMESLGLTESHPKCSNKKGHAYKEIDKDGTVECEYCGLRNSLSESLVNEAEVNSDEEFKEYAFTVLKKAFGEEFDEEKAQEVVDGLIAKNDGDYGAMVGALTSSLG